MAIYQDWFAILACILAARIHPKLGWGVFVLLAARVAQMILTPVGMDCTGIIPQEKTIAVAGLVIAAFPVLRPARPPSDPARG